MAFQNFCNCPWCGARIGLQKEEEGRDYVCPVCGCTFTRNSGKWVLGILMAVSIAVPLWIIFPVYGRITAFLCVLAVMLLTAMTSTLEIQSRGRTDLTNGEAATYRAKWKESKWFTMAVAFLVVFVLLLLVLALGLMP